MANNWSAYNPQAPFSDEILSASAKVSETLGTLQDFLNLIRELLELAQALSNLIATNPIEATLAALIAEIDAVLQGLLENFGVHAIFVPVQKQFDDSSQLQNRTSTLIDPTSDDENLQTKNFDSLVDNNAFPGIVEANQELIDIINNAPTSQGGNSAFWRTLYASTKDPGDPNRPRFTEDFAVAGTALVFGSSNLSDLYVIFELFDALLRLGNRADLSGKTKPTVQNLRARTLPISSPAPARIGVQLRWDKLGPAITFPSFTDDQFIITEFLVIRSTNPQLREATAWSDVFSRQPSLTDSSDLPESGDAKVIARLTNDGFVVGYTDRDETLIEGQAYYYTVAPIIEVDKGPGEDSVDLPVGNLSNVVRVEFNRPVDSKQGEPPDWIGTPSIASLFPTLEALINEIRLALASLLNRSLTGPNLLDQLIKQIEALVARGELTLRILDEINARLAALLTQAPGGIFATVYSVDVGGIDAWTGELANRLSDPTDPTRPPFDGNELVAGVVIVGGAPTSPELSPLLALLELFFGSSDSNALLDAVNQIDVAVADAEKLVFADNMDGTRVSPDTPDEEEPKVAFDESMQPVDSTNCN